MEEFIDVEYSLNRIHDYIKSVKNELEIDEIVLLNDVFISSFTKFKTLTDFSDAFVEIEMHGIGAEGRLDVEDSISALNYYNGTMELDDFTLAHSIFENWGELYEAATDIYLIKLIASQVYSGITGKSIAPKEIEMKSPIIYEWDFYDKDDV